jgi:hypothetical protein
MRKSGAKDADGRFFTFAFHAACCRIGRCRISAQADVAPDGSLTIARLSVNLVD